MRAGLTTPRAIVLGAAILGVATYLGLRPDRDDGGTSAREHARAGDAAEPGAAAAAGVEGRVALDRVPQSLAARDRQGRAEGVAPPDRPPPTGSAVVPKMPPPPADFAAMRARTQAQAEAGISALQATLDRQCWRPALPKLPPGEEVSFSVSLGFAADGTVRASGLSSVAGRPTAELSRCLTTAVRRITVEPPGKAVQVLVPLSFTR